MKNTSFCMIYIVVSLQLFIAGCDKKEEAPQTSEKRPVHHAPEDASHLIGKSKDQLLALWEKPSSWSSQGRKGSEIEHFTYHFLKSGGRHVLQEHMRTGQTSDGKLMISFSPFAAEVLENYWVWRVSIEKGFVTDALCLNNEQHPAKSDNSNELLPGSARATPTAKSYLGFSSLACSRGGCLALVLDEQGKKGLLRWDRRSNSTCTFLRIEGSIPDVSWKLCVGLDPYDYYPKLHFSDDGTLVQKVQTMIRALIEKVFAKC